MTAYTICVGNEKGGSGKSTAAIHLVTTFMRYGFTVGCLDLDTRQKSFGTWLENRELTRKSKGWSQAKIVMPRYHRLKLSDAESRTDAETEDHAAFTLAFEDLREACDFIIIDSPGHDIFLSRLGHAVADTVITPLNDSHIDYDVIAKYDPHGDAPVRPSIYSDMISQVRRHRAESGWPDLDWIVMRNRFAPQANRNSISADLERISKRLKFRVVGGLPERVIYRDLFRTGLTIHDVEDNEARSYQAARGDIEALIADLRLPGFETEHAEAS